MPPTAYPTALLNRNLTVDGKRTSMRLEGTLWAALAEIARRQESDVGQLVQAVEDTRGATPRTSAVRVFIVRYFWDRAK